MEIIIRYGNNAELTEEEINLIIATSEKYGNVNVEKWGVRFGSIDIVPILEVILGAGIIKEIVQPIVREYVNGLINKSFFKGIGEKHRLLIIDKIVHIKNYFTAFYNVFIAKKTFTSKAIALVENIDDCILYVTLNDSKMSEKLLENLADALVRTYALVSLRLIEIEQPKVIQLYPNFDTQEWDFLFIPTVNAFGKYVDRYYCFSNNQISQIENADDFIKKFKITDIDEYKFIINPTFYTNCY